MTSNGNKEIKQTTAHHSSNNVHQNGTPKKNASGLNQGPSSVRRPMRANNMAIKRQRSTEPSEYRPQYKRAARAPLGASDQPHWIPIKWLLCVNKGILMRQLCARRKCVTRKRQPCAPFVRYDLFTSTRPNSSFHFVRICHAHCIDSVCVYVCGCT